MQTYNVKTSGRDDIIDITAKVNQAVAESNVKEGLCFVYTPHTTAGITINENADSDVQTDFIMGLDALPFEDLPFRHAEGNSQAHLKSSIIGCSETIIIDNGRLVLGTWQGIYFCEFDGPRTRKFHVKIMK